MKTDTSKLRITGPTMLAVGRLLKRQNSFSNAEVAKEAGLPIKSVYAPIKRAAERGLFVGVLRYPLGNGFKRVSAKRWEVTGTWEMLGGAEFAMYMVKWGSQLDFLRMAMFGPQSKKNRGDSPLHHQHAVQFFARVLQKAMKAAEVKCPGCCWCEMAKVPLPRQPRRKVASDDDL